MLDKTHESLKILVLEDDFFLAALTKSLLHRIGVQIVEITGSISHALHRIEEQDFDLVLLDVNIQDELSFPVADHLKTRRIPFGFVTGYGRSSFPRRFEGIPILAKPYDEVAMVEHIKNLALRPTITQRIEPGLA